MRQQKKKQKKKTFFLPPPPPPQPKKTAGIGPFWCCPSPLLRLLDGGSLEHFEKKKEGKPRETREEASTEILWLKKKKRKLLMIMEYNKKKMCGSFCHFPFFYLMLLSLFIFEDQYFHGGVLFRRTFFWGCCLFVFCFLCCNLLDLLWLFTPFQMSIGKKKRKKRKERKRSIVPTCDTRPPF